MMQTAGYLFEGVCLFQYEVLLYSSYRSKYNCCKNKISNCTSTNISMLPHLNEIQNMQLEERTNKTKTNVNYFYKLHPQNSLSLAHMWHIVFLPVHRFLIHVVKQHCSSLLQFSFWQWRLVYVQYSVISSLQVPFHFQFDMISPLKQQINSMTVCYYHVTYML